MCDTMLYDMRVLYDDIVKKEKAAKATLHTQDQNRMVYTVKVPSCVGFVEDLPADKFYIDFEEIFNMFHLLRQEETSLVRLWQLHQATKAKLSNMTTVAVADPYHLDDNNLHS